MTALKKFEKIEASALWRETLATQRREVYVNFGDTSLVIRDKHDAPLSHWSLPAIQRLNPGVFPAVYSPNSDANETLEIEDRTMVEAIEQVRTAIERRRPHPGRLRWAIVAAIFVTLVALAVFWLPGALERHTVRVVPSETRQQIGRSVLKHITRLTGQACSTVPGDRALQRLATRLDTSRNARILVLAAGIAKSTHLPGGFILLHRNLVEDFEAAEIAAGYVLIEQLRAEARDPLSALLQHAGGLASFRLLTTGRLDEVSLRNYAQYVLTKSDVMPADAAILARFAKVRLASSPLAYEIDITGETSLALIEADPYRRSPYPPLLTDDDWVKLQTICGG